MSAIEILLPDLTSTERLAASVAALTRPGDAILLAGPLGAGKSAFARAFLRTATGDRQLEVPSPSFTLVQSYDTGIGVVHHFDLWRLDGPGGLAELGWDEARADIVLVEWPDRLGAELPGDALAINLAFGAGAYDAATLGTGIPVAGEARRATLAGWPERIGRLA